MAVTGHSRRCRRVTIIAAIVAMSLVAVGSPEAASADEPSEGAWPVERYASVDAGWSRGTAWVRTNPMMISALIPSMGAPPPNQIDTYFDAFGANTVMLWKDGAVEVPGWQADGDVPFVTWLEPDATSVGWDGTEWVSTGQVLGGLDADRPGRVAFQIGDEPNSLTAIESIEAGSEAARAADPDALVYTNFSYYVSDRDAILDHWAGNVDNDVLMFSDYFFDKLRYSALEYFRARALAAGVPYWQYLNAYVGSESGYERIHTASDLRWMAFVGLAYGYTGHTWFLYQADPERHLTATLWGGSVLYDETGTWDASKTALWDVVAEINRELANLGPTMTQLTSTDVRFIPADRPDAEQPYRTTPWTPGAGGDRYLVDLRAGDGELPMDIVAGFFHDDTGERYVMVQNARHTHSLGATEDPLPGADRRGMIHLEFDFSAAPYTVDRTRLEYLDPNDGKVKILPITEELPEPPPVGEIPQDEPPGEEAVRPRWYVDVPLDPGAVLLFKYTDTIPFRRGPFVEGVGVVDPSQGVWHLRESGGVNSFYFGNPGDVPFMGDWDCDGVDTPGLYRQSDGYVYLRNSNSQGIADIDFFFGNPGDVPIAGDFDGDGCDTVSIYRPHEAAFYIINRLGTEGGGLGVADVSYVFGNPGDRPFTGDFDGDGIDTVGLHRASTGLMYLRNSHTPGNADVQFIFGDPGDTVVAGDWDGDGQDSPGVFRPDEARFYLRFENSAGPADVDFLYGQEGWLAVAGHVG